MTVLLMVTNPVTRERTKLRTVLDCGCDCSYITTETAQTIGCVAENSRTINLGVFGEKDTKKMSTSSIPLLLSFGQEFELQVAVDTTPIIAQNITVFDPHSFRANHPEYSQLPFADPAMNQNIDLLIGISF